jgi:hypothetical protein
MRKATAIAFLLACVLASMGTVTLINLTTQVTGVLPAANGGTGQNSTATYPASGTVATTATVPNAGSCTNQVETASNNGAGPTCSSVSNAMLAAGSYVQGTFYAFCTGAVATASTNFEFAGFGGTATACSTSATAASGGMRMPTAGTVKNLFMLASAAGKTSDKVTILKNGSSTGAPTCTFGTGTSCSDTSTALAVAAGDTITISITTGSSDTAANVAVSFELWN